MNGQHLTADLRGCRCDSAWLTDANRLLARCVALVQAAGLQAVAQLAHRFPDTPHGPGGVTATVLLAESHLCVHTWPEQAGATLDVFRSEPLPAEHPFWRHPNITVTPHTSARTLREESVAQIVGKILALQRGEPIRGVVDPQRGY